MDEPISQPEEPQRQRDEIPLIAWWRRVRPRHLVVDHDLLNLLLAIAITVAAMLVAAGAGALLATFGLAWGALAMAVVIVLAGLLVHRQSMLPLALVATASAVPAAAVTLQQAPLDRSAGLMVVRPAHLHEIDGRELRRGVGSILLDLRELQDVVPHERHKVVVRSDLGRIVVALPRNRCINLRVRATRRARPLGTAARLALRVLHRGQVTQVDALGANLITDAWRTPDQGGVPPFADTNLIAYGREVLPRGAAQTYSRDSGDPAAPTLELELDGAGPSIVRDYPRGVGPMIGVVGAGEQVADANWPLNVVLPRTPDAFSAFATWREIWTPAQVAAGIPEQWATWERRSVVEQRELAKRAAGSCASKRDLGSYWATQSFGGSALPSVQAYDARGNPVDAWEAVAAAQQGGALFGDGGRPLSGDQLRTLTRIANAAYGYSISVNGLGEVRRLQLERDGTYHTSTMTAGNPSGVEG